MRQSGAAMNLAGASIVDGFVSLSIGSVGFSTTQRIERFLWFEMSEAEGTEFSEGRRVILNEHTFSAIRETANARSSRLAGGSR